MSLKEQYWKYSLIVIILLLGVLIFLKITPFLGGILGAMTVYILLREHMIYLTDRRHIRRSIAALLILIETILCFLIPLSLIIWMFVNKFQDANLNPRSIIDPITKVTNVIQERTGYNLMSKANINSIFALLPRIGQVLMESITSFAINVLVLLFVLYFMLIGGKKMENYVNDLLPFNRRNKKDILREFHMVVKSNAIGVPLLAIIQGAAAAIGYLIFGAPAPLLWGVISCFATIIPVIGTAIVWVPLALYMGASGDWGNAIGLAVYALVVISNVDNLVRSIMQKRMADTHPLITIFGVIIGLALFGFMGVIFGPLLLAIFALCVQIFKDEYLEKKD